MMERYRSKIRSLDEAVASMRPRDELAIALGPGQTGAFLDALGTRDDWEDLAIFGGLLLSPHPVLFQRGVRLLSGFYGPVERMMATQGYPIEFVPADFRRFAVVARKRRPRVVTAAVAPPDAHGRMSLALHAGATVDELHRAAADPDRLVIAEVNPRLPRTFGIEPEHSHCLTVDEVDVIVEADRPLTTLPEVPASDVEKAIAGHIRQYVHDGVTLQTGIGGIPNTVVEILAGSAGGDYGVHSEMFTTGLMKLHQAGKVTNKKGIFDGVSICTFALGSDELHGWLHERPDVRFLPVGIVNDSHVIARNRAMLSINGALAVDLHGQLAADTIEGRQYSGIGGAEDFVAGAALAEGGHSIVCLPSTATVGDHLVSRIVSEFGAGALVTTPRHQVDVVVTEYGAAELTGLTVRQRAEALVTVAHPDFRAELRRVVQRR